jgi:molecular chaperone DnaK (HSP70)
VGNFTVEGLTPVAEPNEVLCRMSLDLDGILRVEAVEKRTGMSKHILIRDAIKPKSETELAQAHARLRRLYSDRAEDLEPVWEGSEPTDPEPVSDAVEATKQAPEDPELEAAVAAAHRLIDKSRRLLANIHAEDKEEIIDLHEKIQEAIDISDRQALSSNVHALQELLFFIEGK